MGINLLIGEEVVLPQFNRGKRYLFFVFVTRPEKTTTLEIQQVKHHEHAHTHTFKQPDKDQAQAEGKGSGWSELFTILELVQVEPPDVGECEEGRNDGIRAALSLKRMLDFSIHLHVSVDGSLRLKKEPDHQTDH